MVFSNHIAGFYDHHYLLKNSMMTSDFIHIIVTQRNDKSEANTFYWVWLHMHSHRSVLVFLGMKWHRG